MKIFLITYIISLIVSYYYMRKDFIQDGDEHVSLGLLLAVIGAIIVPIVNTAMAITYFILFTTKYITDIRDNSLNPVNKNYINIINKLFFVKHKPPF